MGHVPASVVAAGESSVSATVTDTNGNVVSGETVTFSFAAQGSGAPSLSAVTAQTNGNGVATITYTAGSAVGTDTISAEATNGTTSTLDIAVSAEAVIVSSISLTAGAANLIANGASTAAIRAVVLDVNSEPVVGEVVSFTTTAGTLSSATATTDTNG